MFPSFPTYDAFLVALGEMLSTEFYGETYPDYSDEHETMGDVDEKYILHFLSTGLDAQEGLSKILDCFFNNTRYAQESGLIKRSIRSFLDAGASLYPLTSKIVAIPTGDLEEGSSSIEVRSSILDTFWNYLDQEYVQAITDWASVKPTYWEYIPGNEEPTMAAYRYYKCCSDYLRGEHQRYAGCEDEEKKRVYAKIQYMNAMTETDAEDM